jgi:hypothetical protein
VNDESADRFLQATGVDHRESTPTAILVRRYLADIVRFFTIFLIYLIKFTIEGKYLKHNTKFGLPYFFHKDKGRGGGSL